MDNQSMQTEETVVTTNKKKLGERIRDNIKNVIVNVFYRYPVTMITIILTMIMATILIDSVGLTLLSKAAVFGAVFAAGSLTTEQYFLKKWISKVIGWTIAIVIAGLWVFLAFQNPEAPVFGEMYEYYYAYCIRVLTCYIITMVLVSVYGMYRNSKLPFQEYCLNVFCAFLRTTIVYTIFAIGIASIIYAFNVLIFDTDKFDFIYRIEVLLAGGIYVPGIILAFSDVKGKISKFAHVVVNYVLMGLLMCTFVIVYIYLFKILFQWEIPSNESFNVLSSVFALGLPIWTIVAANQKHWYGKTAYIMPLAFAPMVVLQGICIVTRIMEYGVTPSRYAALALLAFEVCYIAINYIKKSKHVAGIIFVALVIVWIGGVIPGINMYAVSVYSQTAKFEAFDVAHIEELSEEELDEYSDIYYSLIGMNAEGKLYLLEHYPDLNGRIFNYAEEYDEKYPDLYFATYNQLDEMNVNGYRSVTLINHQNSDSDVILEDMDAIYFCTDSGMEYWIDLSEYIDDIIANRESINDQSLYLHEHNPVLLPDGNTFYFTDLSFKYYENGEIKDFSARGYLLEK